MKAYAAYLMASLTLLLFVFLPLLHSMQHLADRMQP